MIKSVTDNIWHYKYAPETLDDMILSPAIRRKIESFRETQAIPNILLVGHSGIGKSTLAKLIVNDVLKCQYRYINAGDENGIDTIRMKVTDFVQTKGFDGRKKAVILDEASHLTFQAQGALKNVMEQHIDTVSFILTGNHSHMIVEAIKSRCQEYDLTFSIKEYGKRILNILNKEKIQFDKGFVLNRIKTYYPDFRKCLNELEKYTVDGVLESKLIEEKQIVSDIYAKTLDKSVEILEFRKFVMSQEENFNKDYINITEKMFDYITSRKDINEQEKGESLIELCECLKSYPNVMNYEINFSTTMLKIRNIISC
jgi:DNA polymerase III delta prime subunit